MKSKKKRTIISARKVFAQLIEKSGMELSFEKVSEIIFKVAIMINVIISGIIIYMAAVHETVTLSYIIIIMFALWTVILIAALIIIWLGFFLYIDVKIYRRKIRIEDVLPDFLQLTSANIRAGMPIDRALWHAIRPNFGVLAKEIEDVAKQTMSGTELESALYAFGAKYDSPILQRSLSLLIEGLNAGGEIGELLDRISTNIQESKLIQKEMSASVTTYAIFISIAAVGGAPFLLALSSQLLVVIQSIISNIEIPKTSNAMTISFSTVGVTPTNFRIFALTTLTISAIISAAIVATIIKGDIKDGLKYIPMFVITSIILFLILEFGIGLFIGDMF